MVKKTKAATKVMQHFQKEARAIIEEFGGRLLMDSNHTDYVSAKYELQTKFGRLKLTVYDNWIPTRFDRSNLAISIAGNTGKWNHHCFGLGERGKGIDYVNDFLEGFKSDLQRIEAREFNFVNVEVAPQDVTNDKIEGLLDRQAFGERFSVVGFDQFAAAEEVASQVTDNDGERPDWLVQSVRNSIIMKSPIEAYINLQSWRERVGTLHSIEDDVEETGPKF